MILSILKVIGIVILVILALLILILGILLFVPIRYQLSGEYKENAKADVLIKWTPILLKVTANYRDKKFEYIVRMFGGVVMTNTDVPLSWLGKKFFDSSKKEKDDNFDDGKEVVKKEVESPLDEKNSISNDESELVIEANDKSDASYKLNDEKRKIGLEKKKHHPHKKSIIYKFRKKIGDVKVRINRFVHKLQKLNDKREALIKVYHSKRFQVAKTDLILYIKTLWFIIRPKKLEGYIHFGFEDPAVTGQALGVIGMFLACYDSFLTIAPDFEKSCIDGYLNGSGKFRLFPLVKLLIKIILNKNLIKVIKKVQTIIEA
ncbi:MAG: DUF2953 domain-containing protein [Lachnospiraceae bacterium]|nr:DUF2953 domain-containing protein [Lachnospiraceae bacterium]